MATPRIPIEVCELIIDACAHDVEVEDRWLPARTLLACALTCTAWVPRSLMNLYRTVVLCGDNNTRTFVENFRRLSNLALRIHCVENYTYSIQNSTEDFTPSSFYLVTLHLAGLPKNILDVHTVAIISLPVLRSFRSRFLHRTWKSYSRHLSSILRSVSLGSEGPSRHRNL